MVQKLRVPMGFAIAAAVLYLAEPTLVSILVGLPVAVFGALFRALAAGVIKKDSTPLTGDISRYWRKVLAADLRHGRTRCRKTRVSGAP